MQLLSAISTYICFLLWPTLFPIDSGEIEITVKNITSVSGDAPLMVAVYERSGFLKDGAEVIAFDTISTAPVCKIILKEVPPGEYAVAIYQDLNNNGKLNKNLLGIPKEPVGFSNNFTIQLRAPEFKNTKFLVKKQATTNVEITLLEY